MNSFVIICIFSLLYPNRCEITPTMQQVVDVEFYFWEVLQIYEFVFRKNRQSRLLEPVSN